MSRTTKEINRITTTIISMSVRLLFYALVFFLLYEGSTRGYSLGHEIFAPTAVERAPGTDRKVTIAKGESVSEVAGVLEKGGLIKNKLVFMIQARFYDYEVYPGTYILNTSMTSKDMLKLIDESGAAEKKANEGDEKTAAKSNIDNSNAELNNAGSSGSIDDGNAAGNNDAADEDGAYEEW